MNFRSSMNMARPAACLPDAGPCRRGISRPAFAVAGLSAVLCLLTSCSLPTPQADTVRHFTLSAPAPGAAVADAALVRPVRLSGHLRNRAMAVRVSENEVVYVEDVRWAEPLDEAITQVLRQRLRQVGGGAVVTVQVQRCELVQSAGNAVQLSATYTIAPAEGEARTGAFSASTRTWDGKDYGALVALLQDAVNELAETIATAAGQK